MKVMLFFLVVVFGFISLSGMEKELFHKEKTKSDQTPQYQLISMPKHELLLSMLLALVNSPIQQVCGESYARIKNSTKPACLFCCKDTACDL